MLTALDSYSALSMALTSALRKFFKPPNYV
jgi:hypothetical protein